MFEKKESASMKVIDSSFEKDHQTIFDEFISYSESHFTSFDRKNRIGVL